MVEMSYQREANVLGADYFERQGWHPPKEKMSKQQKNSAFVKMLKEFPKVFGRVSFRERLMLRTAFDYINEEVIVTLENENADLKARYNRVDIIGYDALKNLTEAKDIIRALLFHITNDTFYVTFETQEQSVERARQFLRGAKENE